MNYEKIFEQDFRKSILTIFKILSHTKSNMVLCNICITQVTWSIDNINKRIRNRLTVSVVGNTV